MYRAKRLSQMFDRTRNTSLHLMRNLSVLMVAVQGEKLIGVPECKKSHRKQFICWFLHFCSKLVVLKFLFFSHTWVNLNWLAWNQGNDYINWLFIVLERGRLGKFDSFFSIEISQKANAKYKEFSSKKCKSVSFRKQLLLRVPFNWCSPRLSKIFHIYLSENLYSTIF